MDYGIVTYTRLPKLLKEQFDQFSQEDDKPIAALLRDAAKMYAAARVQTLQQTEQPTPRPASRKKKVMEQPA